MSNSSPWRPGKALVIMVSEDGQVENRVIDTPPGLPVSALTEASNYLNARLRGRTIDAARAEILAELEGERAMLDALTAKMVAEGLATLAQPGGTDEKVLIVRGTVASAGQRRGPGRHRAHPHPVRRYRAQGRPDPASGTGQGGRRGAHFHRLGEPAVLACRVPPSWPRPMPMPRARSWA